MDVAYEASGNVAAACSKADIIITATSAREAVIQSEWVKPGTHLSCMGADMPVKQEIDEKLVARASLFADDIEQVTTVGECKIAWRKHLIEKSDITEIGQVISGIHPGRTSEKEITLFDSTGIAIQDLITAKAVIDIAGKKGLGEEIIL